MMLCGEQVHCGSRDLRLALNVLPRGIAFYICWHLLTPKICIRRWALPLPSTLVGNASESASNQNHYIPIVRPLAKWAGIAWNAHALNTTRTWRNTISIVPIQLARGPLSIIVLIWSTHVLIYQEQWFIFISITIWWLFDQLSSVSNCSLQLSFNCSSLLCLQGVQGLNCRPKNNRFQWSVRPASDHYRSDDRSQVSTHSAIPHTTIGVTCECPHWER